MDDYKNDAIVKANVIKEDNRVDLIFVEYKCIKQQGKHLEFP